MKCNTPAIQACRLLYGLLFSNGSKKTTFKEIQSFRNIDPLFSIFRILLILGVTLRIFLHKEEYQFYNWPDFLIIILLFVYFLFFLSFEISKSARQFLVENLAARRLLISFEIIFISILYFFTGKVDSDFFIFYILPIIYSSIYNRAKESLRVFLFTITFLFLTILSIYLFNSNGSSNYGSVADVFYRIYLSRSFLLVFVGLVIVFYRMIENNLTNYHIESSKKEAKRSKILHQISSLVRVSEYNDPFLVKKVLKTIVAAVTAQDGVGFERAMLFQLREEPGNLQGVFGIGPINKTEGKKIWDDPKYGSWEFDNIVNFANREVKFKSKKLNELISKTIIKRETVRYLRDEFFKPNSSAIVKKNKCLLLSKNLQEFNIDIAALAPIFSDNILVGLLIGDNVVTDKEIGDREWEELATFANFAGEVITNERNIKNHVENETMVALGKASVRFAHEIRNPLESIRGFTEILENKAQDSNNKHRISKISHDVKRIKKIIDKYNRLAISKKRINTESTFLEDVMSEVLTETFFLQQFEKKKIKIENNITKNNKVKVKLDIDLFKSAIRNIIQNSIDSIEEDTDGKISIELEATKKYFQILISDNGTGISETQFPDIFKIFKPFNTTKKLSDVSGVGLGLTISKSAINAHNGNIDVKNNLNGTTFTISCPFS